MSMSFWTNLICLNKHCQNISYKKVFFFFNKIIYFVIFKANVIREGGKSNLIN